MEGLHASGFGRLLQSYRLRAGLTQEGLAERAGISAKAVGAVEQGARRAPHRQTVRVLADALALNEAERESFYTIADHARGRVRRDHSPSPATTLPQPLTPFIKRREVEDISSLLDEHRLVTITGPGGIGKTRTAIEVASRRMLRDASAPVIFIDLTPATDDNLILTKIASALTIRLPKGDPVAALTAAIGDRTLLLVIDNCEHVIAEAAAILARLLPACPALAILATSREVLGISSEVVYRLPSLKSPDTRIASLDEARTYSAIALFFQQASFADATLRLGVDDVPAITEICRKLDGIPLAIQLAASQLPKMGLATLRTRLSGLFDVAAPRDFPARHRTMRATIAWSVDLLDDRERNVFMRASMFSGGFTIDAAEAVTAAEDLPTGSILDIIKALAAKSLLNVDQQSGSTRFTLLDSIRSFGREMLETGGHADAIAQRHAQWLADLGDALLGKSQSILSNAQAEIDNAHAAIVWCLGSGSQERLRLATRIVCGMRRVWRMSGRTAELDRLITDTLAKLDNVEENYQAIGDLYYSRISLSDNISVAVAQEMMPFLERTGNFEDAAMVDVQLALTEVRAGMFDDAAASYARAAGYFDADAARRTGRNYIHYRCIGVWLHTVRGDLAAARAEIVALRHEAEHAVDADQLTGLYQIHAEIESASGNFTAAIELTRTLLERCESELTFFQAGTIVSNLSCYQLMVGDLSGAERSAQLALERLADWQNDRPHWDAVIAMQHLSTALALRGRADVAAMLLGFIDRYRASVVWQLPATDQRSYDMLVRSAADQLSANDVALQRARGAQLDYDAAVDLLQLQA